MKRMKNKDQKVKHSKLDFGLWQPNFRSEKDIKPLFFVLENKDSAKLLKYAVQMYKDTTNISINYTLRYIALLI